ncbi:PotD/PotF family extracellular solute-binding protein [Nocardiopsis mangrovi]|uniref:PotD/PotF family extracellular solute-binding protein n=1 Tax=Nocardiopsis mangrovi TaxID=1179818 RepID=A0ABV9E057_9ACTN
MQSTTRRRVALTSGAATSALLLLATTACGGVDTSGGGGGGDEITVTAFAGEWGSLFEESFVAPFEEETGITVNVVTGADADWLTRLRAAKGENPPFDVVALTSETFHQAVNNDVLEPLDTTRLEHWSQLDPVLVEQSTVEGSAYGAPLTTGSLGLLYRTDEIDEAPQDWTDIFNEEYCGHIALPPLTYNAGLQFFSALVAQNGGTLSEPDAVDRAFEDLEKLKDCVSAYPADAGTVATTIQNGDAWIVPFWDGRAFAMEAEGQPIGFSYPTSGAVGALTSYYIPAGSENTDAAYRFLNYLTSAQHQKPFAQGTFYGGGNDSIEYDPEFTAKVEYGPEVYEGFTWVDYDAATPNLNEWQQRWNEIFQ